MQLIVDVDVAGPRGLLRDMAGRLNSPRPLMGILARELEDYEREQFATSGGGTWAPDDPDTTALKGGGRVLVDTGKLRRQLTSARVVEDTAVVDQGDAYYARYLRDGDRGMPRRNPAPKPDVKQVQHWADQVLHYVVTGRSR